MPPDNKFHFVWEVGCNAFCESRALRYEALLLLHNIFPYVVALMWIKKCLYYEVFVEEYFLFKIVNRRM